MQAPRAVVEGTTRYSSAEAAARLPLRCAQGRLFRAREHKSRRALAPRLSCVANWLRRDLTRNDKIVSALASSQGAKDLLSRARKQILRCARVPRAPLR